MIDKIMSRSGTVDLGLNATGVIESKLHYVELDDEYIIEDVMPAHHVQTCLDEVAAIAGQKQNGEMKLVGRLPIPLWLSWREEWKKTGKQHGMLWRAFLAQKLFNGEHTKFATGIKI